MKCNYYILSLYLENEKGIPKEKFLENLLGSPAYSHLFSDTHYKSSNGANKKKFIHSVSQRRRAGRRRVPVCSQPAIYIADVDGSFIEGKDYKWPLMRVQGQRGSSSIHTPIYKPYRYVPPQRVSFSSISSLKWV